VTLRHFTAYPSTMTCTSDDHALPFNNQIRGVNLGGWLVLEPWITPTLFYQFLGSGQGEVAMDHYSFCDVLGPEEGNRQLRRHWETWVTRDLIGELARGGGAVNSLRVPVGDFMFQPYGPYGEQHIMQGGRPHPTTRPPPALIVGMHRKKTNAYVVRFFFPFHSPSLSPPARPKTAQSDAPTEHSTTSTPSSIGPIPSACRSCSTCTPRKTRRTASTIPARLSASDGRPD
jgi:hypothetical protein